MLGPGSEIGGIRLERLLGRGAMGEVYRGEQLSLKRPVAVKRIADHLLDHPEAIQRFEREAQCVARLQSPHVVQVFDFVRASDDAGKTHCLIVMELIEGGLSLRDALRVHGAFSWQQAASLALQAAEGLAAAAEFGVIHRDVKPDNIMLTRRGMAKLADFGLARAVDSTAMTQEGSLLGTPNYIAPEGCRGDQLDHRADLYSLGATWFHLATGRPPFSGDNLMALLRAHLEQPAPDVRELAPETPAAIAGLIAACLAKTPEARPASALALAERLQALVAEGLVIPRTVPELVAAVEPEAGGAGSSTGATALAGAQTRTATLATAGEARAGHDPRVDPTAATRVPGHEPVVDGEQRATAATALAGEGATAATAVPGDRGATAATALAGDEQALATLSATALGGEAHDATLSAVADGGQAALPTAPPRAEAPVSRPSVGGWRTPLLLVALVIGAGIGAAVLLRAAGAASVDDPETTVDQSAVAAAPVAAGDHRPTRAPASPRSEGPPSADGAVAAPEPPRQPEAAMDGVPAASAPAPKSTQQDPAAEPAGGSSPQEPTPQPIVATTPVEPVTTLVEPATMPVEPVTTPVEPAADPVATSPRPAQPVIDAVVTPAAPTTSTSTPEPDPAAATPASDPVQANPPTPSSAGEAASQPAEDPAIATVGEIGRALDEGDPVMARRWLEELPPDHPQHGMYRQVLADLELRGDRLATATTTALEDGQLGRAERLLAQVRQHQRELLLGPLALAKSELAKQVARRQRQLQEAMQAIEAADWREALRQLEAVPGDRMSATTALRQQRGQLQARLELEAGKAVDAILPAIDTAIAAGNSVTARRLLDQIADAALAAGRYDDLKARRLKL